jgi:YidC/Oxa1 family membrane protein insertase
MEKRLILAIGLSFVVLVLYQAFFVKPPPEAARRPQETVAAPDIPWAQDAPAETEVPAPALKIQETAEPEIAGAVSAAQEETVLVETPLYSAVWSNRGGILTSWKLKEHKARAVKGREGEKEALDMVPLEAAEKGTFPFAVRTGDEELDRILNTAYFRVSQTSLNISEGRTAEVEFEYSDGKGVRAEKRFVFSGGTYAMDMDVRVWKDGREVPLAVIWGPGIGNPTPEELKQRFSAASGAAVFSGGKVHRMDERKYKAERSAFNFVEWAAYEDNYFAAMFLVGNQRGTAVFELRPAEDGPDYFLAVSGPVMAYIGPKEIDRLKAFGHNAKALINFGFFGSIAEILLIGIRFFHGLVPNWGFAIIIMTIVVKILFFPLTYSSSKSMAKMAELQPKIKALRSKYKKAKQDIGQRRQMNEEMMKLYKQHGVNPAGGCLPMLIQLPIFWGFFRMLTVAVEFRHSPFIFWIKDLSVMDPFYVTPLLMGATQFVSMKMTPTSADPAQARMMMIMPVVMTVFFLSFQSGLVLYWLTSNVLQIGQQALMNKMMAKKKRESHGKRK